MNPSFLTRLQTQLARRMREKRFDMKHLSKAAGLAENYVSNIMRGRIKDPSLKRIKQIADQLGCRVDDLLDWGGSAESPTEATNAASGHVEHAVRWVETVLEDRHQTLPGRAKGVVVAKLAAFLSGAGGRDLPPDTMRQLVAMLIETVQARNDALPKMRASGNRATK